MNLITKLRIKDIADRLGVSTATVSRALNNKPGVSDDMRKKVNELVSEIRFAPNMVARNLAGGRTGAVAFILHRQAFPVSTVVALSCTASTRRPAACITYSYPLSRSRVLNQDSGPPMKTIRL